MCVHAVCKCFSGEQPDASFKFLKYIAHMLDSRCFFLSFQTRESEQSLGRLELVWWGVEKLAWWLVVVPLAG